MKGAGGDVPRNRTWHARGDGKHPNSTVLGGRDEPQGSKSRAARGGAPRRSARSAAPLDGAKARYNPGVGTPQTPTPVGRAFSLAAAVALAGRLVPTADTSEPALYPACCDNRGRASWASPKLGRVREEAAHSGCLLSSQRLRCVAKAVLARHPVWGGTITLSRVSPAYFPGPPPGFQTRSTMVQLPGPPRAAGAWGTPSALLRGTSWVAPASLRRVSAGSRGQARACRS